MTRKAFTLIEILVVMSIIGLIVLFLIPTAGRAREAARRVQCINNLRQHGIAWYLYLDDHNYCFPPGNQQPVNGGCSDNRGNFGGKDGTNYNPNTHGAKYRALNRYLDITGTSSPAVEVFHCPDDIIPYVGAPLRTTYDLYGNSYEVNSQIITYQPPPGLQIPRPFSSITRVPRDKVFLEHCVYSNKPGHGKKTGYDLVMVLFVDGHVAGPFSVSFAAGDTCDVELPNNINPSKKVLRDLNGTASTVD